MRKLVALLCLIWPVSLSAADHTQMIRSGIEGHILPGFETLSAATQALEVTS